MKIKDQIAAVSIPNTNIYVHRGLVNVVTRSEGDHNKWLTELIKMGCKITKAKSYQETDGPAWTIHARFVEPDDA